MIDAKVVAVGAKSRVFSLLVAVAAAIGWVATATAGEYNSVLSIGDKAPSFAKLPGTDDKQHSMTDYKDKEILVVVFTCNSCPYAVDYEDRINAFAKKHSDPKSKVALVAINVNLIDEDKMPAMKERAKEKKLVYPYLYDETQKVARDYGAVFTPEFFVLDKDRRVVYMGAMDDSSDSSKAKVNYVEQAIAAVEKGEKPAKTETPAVGCQIRFKRVKRTKK